MLWYLSPAWLSSTGFWCGFRISLWIENHAQELGVYRIAYGIWQAIDRFNKDESEVGRGEVICYIHSPGDPPIYTRR